MCITGSLTDFSLPEIFHFIEKGNKTGLLALQAFPESLGKLPSVHYIWVYQGRIVAAANRLDQQGLVSLIEQSHLVSDRVLDKLVHWCCPISEPLGLYLKNQGVLQVEHLRQLFNIQVMQQLWALSQLKDGQFHFEQNTLLPTREMTGLSVPAAVLDKYSFGKVLLTEIDSCCPNKSSRYSSIPAFISPSCNVATQTG